MSGFLGLEENVFDVRIQICAYAHDWGVGRRSYQSALWHKARSSAESSCASKVFCLLYNVRTGHPGGCWSNPCQCFGRGEEGISEARRDAARSEKRSCAYQQWQHSSYRLNLMGRAGSPDFIYCPSFPSDAEHTFFLFPRRPYAYCHTLTRFTFNGHGLWKDNGGQGKLGQFARFSQGVLCYENKNGKIRKRGRLKDQMVENGASPAGLKQIKALPEVTWQKIQGWIPKEQRRFSLGRLL